MQEDVIFKRRNRLKKHFINISNVLLYGYKDLSDGAKITYQVIEGFDWESKETGDSKGFVFPSIETISVIRNSAKRTIFRHIQELEKVKLLTRTRRRNLPSVLYIEDVSDNEANLYLSHYVDKDHQKPMQDDLLKSRNAKNGTSHKAPEMPKMALAYKVKEKELKENEINVNEDFKTFKNEGVRKPNRGQGTTSLRDIMIQYKLDISRKVKNKPEFQVKIPKIDKNERDYLASEIAEKLNDQKSLGAFRVIAERVPQSVVFEVLSSIKETAREGKIRVSRGALFVDIIKGYCSSHSIDLGFGTKETSPDIVETQRGIFTTS